MKHYESICVQDSKKISWSSYAFTKYHLSKIQEKLTEAKGDWYWYYWRKKSLAGIQDSRGVWKTQWDWWCSHPKKEKEKDHITILSLP